MALKKDDHYVQTFMGSTYEFGNPETVGELKSLLEEMASDLPVDPDLKIAEVHVYDGKLVYTLADGIVE